MLQHVCPDAPHPLVKRGTLGQNNSLRSGKMQLRTQATTVGTMLLDWATRNTAKNGAPLYDTRCTRSRPQWHCRGQICKGCFVAAATWVWLPNAAGTIRWAWRGMMPIHNAAILLNGVIACRWLCCKSKAGRASTLACIPAIWQSGHLSRKTIAWRTGGALRYRHHKALARLTCRSLLSPLSSKRFFPLG